jgi:hypothetical protein
MKNKGKILLEYQPVEIEVVDERIVDEKTGDKELDIDVIWQKADKINSNSRRYRKKVLEKEIDRLQKPLKNKEVFGAAYHPIDGIGETTDVSHRWNKIWMDKEGTCKGNLTVLPTSKGKDIQVIVKAGRIGMSSRGFGTVTKKEEDIDGKKIKFDDIDDNFKLKSPGDFVMSPSVEGAGNTEIAEAVQLLESKLNETLDSQTQIEEEEIMSDKIKTIEDLKKEYPELTQEIEEKAKEGLFTEEQVQERVNSELETKKNEWKTEMEPEVQQKIDDATEKAKAEGTIEAYRDVVSYTSEKDGVIPEGEKKKIEKEENKEEINALTQERDDLKKKVEDFENAEKERKEADKKAKEGAELQTALRTKLDEELEKEEHKAYKELIEKELTDDEGKITIDSVEAVEEAVKSQNEKIASLAVEAEKAKILASGTKPKGEVENPEGDEDEKKALMDKQRAFYKEAKNAGQFKGTFEDYKKEFPIEE